MGLKKIPVPVYKYTNKWNGEITKVQIIKETDHSVFFKNGRSAKTSSDTVFRDTPEEVFEWVKESLKDRMNRQKRIYLQRKKQYDEFVERGMICK